MTKIYRVIMEDIVIADHVQVADSFFSRLKGLLGRKGLKGGEGLLIIPCKQVHTKGMQFPIDVIFLTKFGVVIQSEESMVPGKMSRYVTDARQVLELRSGTIAASGIRVGKTITFERL